jgi:hypothetical protein
LSQADLYNLVLGLVGLIFATLFLASLVHRRLRKVALAS